MNPLNIIRDFIAGRDHRRALRAHEEWEKVMEQPRTPIDLSKIPDRQLLDAAATWREWDAMHRTTSDMHDKVDDLIAEVIRLRAEQPKQTEGDE